MAAPTGQGGRSDCASVAAAARIMHKGKKVAIVRNYTMRRVEDESYCLELDNVYLTADAIQDDVELERISGFTFVVPKHDRAIKYIKCSLLATCDASRGHWEKLWIDASNRIEEEIPA